MVDLAHVINSLDFDPNEVNYFSYLKIGSADYRMYFIISNW